MHEAENLIDVAFDYPQICSHFSEHSSQAMVAVEGRECIVRYANAAFLDLCGTTRSDLIGHSFAAACPQADTSSCMSLLDRVFSTATPQVLAEQLHSAAPPIYWS